MAMTRSVAMLAAIATAIEADDLLGSARHPTGRGARMALDRRHVLRLLHGLRNGFGEHFILAA
jgi:hypothetical protein